MQLGIIVAPTTAPRALAGEALGLQGAGVHAIWVPDHLSGGTHFKPPWFAMPVALSIIAEQCADILLGPLVASMVLRPSATLRCEMESLAAVAPGRLRVALGAGSASDAALTGMPRSPELLASYAARVRSDAYPLYIASSSTTTVGVTRDFDGWVSVGAHPEKSYGPAEIAAKIELYDRLRSQQGGQGHRVLLIDPNEPNPWANEAAMVTALTPWATRVDEVVLWHPRTFDETPGVSFSRAIFLAANVGE